ncbi:MAG: hypothetical protein ACRDZY_00115, partial [Acidimicrobiales bacterium]
MTADLQPSWRRPPRPPDEGAFSRHPDAYQPRSRQRLRQPRGRAWGRCRAGQVITTDGRSGRYAITVGGPQHHLVVEGPG